MSTLYLDLETTGFSRDWDYIIEIAGVLIRDDGSIDQFHQYIKPGKKIPAQVVELTGITNEQVMNCPSEKRVLQDFVEWVCINKPTQIVGHNCKAFDLGFIRTRCGKYGINWKEDGIEIIDTLQLARELNKSGKIKTANCKQPTLAAYFDVCYSAHSAIQDVKALALIYKKMKELNEPPTRASLGF